MEIKITITVPGQIEPMEIKVDVPAEESEIERIDRPDASVYAVWFNEGCTGWTKNPEMNKLFLIQKQDYATVKLKKYGSLSLNEVYDMLGCPRTKYGQVAGWFYTKDCSAGDNWVDFGLFDERNQDFVNGLEPNALLDFNCKCDYLRCL
jgi:hypothetical protein